MEDLTSGQLEAATRAIDEANGADPNTLEVRGRSGPKELLHSEMMTDWVQCLDPAADAAQLVAARAHHLRRWTHPRDAYPQGRVGYRRWRTAAARAQAEEVASILLGIGAGPHFIERVGDIIRKRGLGSDPAVQTHEDALCLVFLETQLDDVIESLGVKHATAVVARTIPKMSAGAIEHAAALELSPTGREVLAAAADAANRESSQ
jgi:hypothetical protein